MSLSRALPDRLRRLFLEQFTVADVAEVVASFDSERPAAEVRAFMEERDYDAIGVRIDGLVRGYANRDELDGGTCGDHLHEFEADDRIADNASLIALIKQLGLRRRCFVSSLGEMLGIATMGDLEKAPVRMWLFGMITMTEMRLVEELRERFPNDSWTDQISERRLEKAIAMRDERVRRRQSAMLLDCLQFSDKAQIALRVPEMREQLGVRSRESGQKLFRRLEALRNNLAHAQEIASTDWKSIIGVALMMEGILLRD